MIVFRNRLLTAVALSAGLAPPLLRADVPIYGGPAYSSSSATGYANIDFPPFIGNYVNTFGQAVGFADKWDSGVAKGIRAMRWDSAGSSIELGNLGLNSSGVTNTQVFSIGASGDAIGVATKYVGGTSVGDRPVRWDASGNAIELGLFGTTSSGFTTGRANAINGAGESIGTLNRYFSGVYFGSRPVKWTGSGTGIQLGTLNFTSDGVGVAEGYAINSLGAGAGYSELYSANVFRGRRAVAWDVGGGVQELANLGVSSSGVAYSAGYSINSGGQVVGFADKYTGGTFRGQRAVLWKSDYTAVELGNLGVDASGFTISSAYQVNDAGQSVGVAELYVGGVDKGYRAVRWDSTGAITQLAGLGTDSSGVAFSEAYSINSLGEVAGYAEKYNAGVLAGRRAMVWLADGTPLDLNTLIQSSQVWSLTSARSISDNGWVAGYGMFDPDGGGPLSSYQRGFTLQINAGDTWTNAAGGTWSDNANWSTGFAPGTASSATFTIGSAYTINVTSPVAVKSVGVYSGHVTLAMADQTMAVAGQLSISNAASLTLNGGYVTAKSVSGGELILTNGALVAIKPSGTATGVSKIKQLNIAAVSDGYDGTFQIKDNALIIDYLGGPTPYANILAMVKSGMAQFGGNGSGITSSKVESGAVSGVMVAVVDNANPAISGFITNVFGYNDFSNNSIIIRYTWIGDGNLDGVVNNTDYALIDSGFADSGVSSGWFYGDFNYDGKIDSTDYALIDTGFGSQSGTLPEPSVLGVVSLIGLLGRRTSRRCRQADVASAK